MLRSSTASWPGTAVLRPDPAQPSDELGTTFAVTGGLVGGGLVVDGPVVDGLVDVVAAMVVDDVVVDVVVVDDVDVDDVVLVAGDGGTISVTVVVVASLVVVAPVVLVPVVVVGSIVTVTGGRATVDDATVRIADGIVVIPAVTGAGTGGVVVVGPPVPTCTARTATVWAVAGPRPWAGRIGRLSRLEAGSSS